MTAPTVRQRPAVSGSVRQRRQARTGRLDVRVGASGLAAVDNVGIRDGVERSEAARRLLAYAVANMPPGWHPGVGKRIAPPTSSRIGGRRP